MTDSERVELNELCSALVDGVLSPEDRARLEHLLWTSDEARRFYVRTMQLSASLHHYAAEMQSEPAEPANVIRVSQWKTWVWSGLAAAAAVVLGLVIFRPGTTAPEVDDAEMVARLTGGKDCQWMVGDFETGDELAAGQQLVLKSGYAELTFDSGAQVVLEGPATLGVRSAWEAELQKGTLKANVPQEAIGFRVVNSAVEVVDLGTEFSVSANEDGTAEVFVLQGAVEVHPKDAKGNRQPKAVLQEKQAKRFARADSPGDVRDREEKFQKFMRKVAIDRMAKPLNYARWSFDEGGGDFAAANTSAGASGAMKVAPAARWVPGRFGSALQMDGTFAMHAELKPPLRRGIRTVAFWTKVPAAGVPVDAGPFVAFPTQKGWGSMLEMRWNRRPAEGSFGAMRFDSPVGSLVGTSSLRDGRWHHIAVVLGPVGKGPAKQPLKLYVNGRLENLNSKRPLTAGSDKLVEEPRFWLGGSPLTSERFEGVMDELIIAEQPLTPQEIRHLIRTNSLLSPEAIAKL